MTDRKILEEKLKEMSKTGYGKVLRELIDQEVADMCDLEKNPLKNLQDGLSRQNAIKILKKVFSVIYENMEQEKKENKNEYN
jgi:hypothetical protein